MIKKIFIISFFLLTALAACGNSNYLNVNVHQLKKAIESGQKILILDVRTTGEYTGELGHIAGSKLIPLHLLSTSLEQISGFKNLPVYVICRSGNRSITASIILAENGFKKVFNVEGGMRAWNSAAYPISR